MKLEDKGYIHKEKMRIAKEDHNMLCPFHEFDHFISVRMFQGFGDRIKTEAKLHQQYDQHHYVANLDFFRGWINRVCKTYLPIQWSRNMKVENCWFSKVMT